MKREIKFRAWDGRKMVYESGVAHLSLEDKFVYKMAKFWCNIVPSSEIMQFTGLHDKNGKEIYEGDMLVGAYKKKKYIVEWQGSSFKCTHPTHGIKKWPLSPGMAEHLTIIGNIYESPELLNP